MRVGSAQLGGSWEFAELVEKRQWNQWGGKRGLFGGFVHLPFFPRSGMLVREFFSILVGTNFYPTYKFL